MLLDLVQNHNNFSGLFAKLARPGSNIIHGLTNSAKSLMLSNIFLKQKKHFIYVVQNHHEVQNYHREINNIIGQKVDVFNFPCQEISPYDQISSDIAAQSKQYEIFSAWQSNKPTFTILPFKAFQQKYVNKKIFIESSVLINKKTEIDPSDLAKQLIILGYSKQFIVEGRGQFSHRGDILDIYPLVGEPVRIEFFGDEIDTIRTFSISSQRSIDNVESFILHPRYGVVRSEEDGLVDKIRSQIDKYSSALDTESQEVMKISLENSIETNALYWEGIEYYRELVEQDASSLFEFFPEFKQVHAVFDEWEDMLIKAEAWQKKIQTQYYESVQQGQLLPLEKELYLETDIIKDNFKVVSACLYLQTMIETDDDGNEISTEVLSYPAERFASKVDEFVTYIKTVLRDSKHILIFSEQPQRVTGILKEWDIDCQYVTQGGGHNIEELLFPGRVIVQRDGLDEGCKIPDLDLVVLTDRELFGKSRQAVARQKNTTNAKKEAEAKTKRAKNVYTDVSDLQNGSFVIHYKHGLGKYIGTELVELQGIGTQEYLVVEYANEARVLIPVDQVNMLSRFDMGPELKPKLSKLGSSEWTRTKKKVRTSVKKIAQDLVKLYAERAKQKGHTYQHDTPWQLEMEDAFPYDETEDQVKAISALKQDMEAEKLMDRLVCGDAGFGKTEVVIRAIFKAIMEGKQVAVLVPTTVLAQQHFNVMQDRFAPYPIKLGLLSRFKSAKEQKDVIQALKLGECDLVIGTHRLLQKDIQFKDLGLLVIDEEQRFGVAHKEKLKDLRKDLDVISMSATPIPRTLHMALSGIKDISLISTAPTNRLPIKTFVGEYKLSVIRNAILHEIERGGKVFFLHNRVESIQSIAYEISELVPEAQVRVAHGQMKPQELEDTMFSFVNNEFNILVCTTIIETGLDISDANTMIINNSNHFGLSQLYQLRGRVGRSSVQAYAYLLYKDASELSETARQRLKAIRELNTLGSGYQIALRDMEIRGVGNVFGGEQHGHMVAVGASLYFKMLEDAIGEVRGERSEIDDFENACSLDIKVAARFPDTWIQDERQRMNEYKRLSMVVDESDLDDLVAEWQDRFGRLPVEAKQLTEVSRLKILANSIGIESITEETEGIKVFANIRLAAWMKAQAKLHQRIASKTLFKAGSMTSRLAKSHILFKPEFMDSDQKIEAIRDILIVLQD